jgi:hypothetical protein
VPVNREQILDLGNTPVVLVDAPGAGMFINITSLTVQTIFGTLPYSIPDSAVLVISILDVWIRGGQLGSIITVAGNYIQHFFEKNAVGTPENQPVLFLSTPVSPIEGDGSLVFYITYEILEV